jgi:Xaa-Pro dipeptidase
MSGTSTRGFATVEFERRLGRAQTIMGRRRFDALLLTSAANIRYFTGFDTQFWQSPTRPWFVVVPLGGHPIAVIPEIGARSMARTWVRDIRTWPAPRPDDDGTTLLASTLSSLPRRFGRIGAELGREMSLRMPVVQFLALGRLMLDRELTDGSPCIWEIRMLKTDAEVERIRRVCRIVGDAYEALPACVGVGDDEREVCRRLTADVIVRGADAVPYMAAASGPGGVSEIIGAAGDRRLEAGDLLFIDTGATFDGYFCDFDRTYAVGHVSSDATRAHEAVWRATEAGIAAAAPGSTAEEVWRCMAEVLAAAGSIGNNVGRLGHGLGLQLTEPPSLMSGDQTRLEVGMVLAIEPGMECAPAKMIVHEEDIVITPDGCELLTRRAPSEPWVIR